MNTSTLSESAYPPPLNDDQYKHARTSYAAAAAALRYTRLRRHTAVPLGFTLRGIWRPYGHEWKSCCDDIRPATPRYPHRYWRHCHSLRHVATTYGVTIDELRAALHTHTTQEHTPWTSPRTSLSRKL